MFDVIQNSQIFKLKFDLHLKPDSNKSQKESYIIKSVTSSFRKRRIAVIQIFNLIKIATNKKVLSQESYLTVYPE